LEGPADANQCVFEVWGLLTLNSGGIDEKSLAMLDGSSQRVAWPLERSVVRRI